MAARVLSNLVVIAMGLLMILFAPKMVESNARAYPRLYPRAMKVFSLLLAYVVGAFMFGLGLYVLVAFMVTGK